MSGESLERYFRVIHGPREKRPSGSLWCPAADVYRTDNGWIVKVDLAGIRPADIEITIDGAILRISGARRDARARPSKYTPTIRNATFDHAFAGSAIQPHRRSSQKRIVPRA